MRKLKKKWKKIKVTGACITGPIFLNYGYDKYN